MIKHIFFFTLLIFSTIGFIYILKPFFEPILWAVTFTVLFAPIYKYFLKLFRGRNSLSSFATIIVFLLTVMIPASLISGAVINEGTQLYEKAAKGEIDFSKSIVWIENSQPKLVGFLTKIGINIEKLKAELSSSAVTASEWIVTNIFSIGQNTIAFTALFFLMLYLLFFFLKDGSNLIDLIVRILPIGDEAERHLLSKFAEVARATVKGTLVVGIIQGTLGGIMFAILGIESAVFWGVIMIVLSILPVVGSALVWFPASIILIANGYWAKAIILFMFGALVVGLIDNLLRPILVGRDTKMPDYLILLSTLGGLALFGLSGFVIGPIIAAFFMAVWVMFEVEYNPDSVK